MIYIGHSKPKLLIADEGFKLRDKNDVYVKATEQEPEHIPYYTDVIFLADNMTREEARNQYVEEKIEE